MPWDRHYLSRTIQGIYSVSFFLTIFFLDMVVFISQSFEKQLFFHTNMGVESFFESSQVRTLLIWWLNFSWNIAQLLINVCKPKTIKQEDCFHQMTVEIHVWHPSGVVCHSNGCYLVSSCHDFSWYIQARNKSSYGHGIVLTVRRRYQTEWGLLSVLVRYLH